MSSTDDDLYAYQRDELMALLDRLSRSNEPLIVHGIQRMTSDDATRLKHKIRQGSFFSEREKKALNEAGFNVQSLFPNL